MYASCFENLDYILKNKNANIVIYENKLYEVDIKNKHLYNVDLSNDYVRSEYSNHFSKFANTLAQAQFVVYYDRTYSYRKYVSPALYVAALTNTVILFDEQSDYEHCLVNNIYKNNTDLIDYVIVNETNCSEKKKTILSNENLMKKLIQYQKEWYVTTKKSKLSLYIQ